MTNEEAIDILDGPGRKRLSQLKKRSNHRLNWRSVMSGSPPNWPRRKKPMLGLIADVKKPKASWQIGTMQLLLGIWELNTEKI